MIYTGPMLRVALFVIPAVAVTGLVLLLNELHANPGLAAVALGTVAVISGATLGYFADHLPEIRRPHRPRRVASVHHGD